MAFDPSLIGRCYPVAGTYQVGREKIREFAEAIGDDDEIYRDPSAARARGYSDVIAPPTFAIILAFRAQQALLRDPELGLDYCRMVHGTSRCATTDPSTPATELVAALHVDSVRSMGGNDMLTVRCEITDCAGDPVTTARSMLVVHHSDAEQDR